MNKNIYKGFGLVIESEIKINELMMDDTLNNPDIQICLGITPKRLDEAVCRYPFYEVGDKKFLFTIENVASYLVENGNRIIIEPSKNTDIHLINVYLLSTAIGVLLHQRNVAALHSSSIVIENQAIAIGGECGTGKSTLSLAFKNMGYDMLSDDISAVKVEKDKKPYVYPSFPQQKLCTDVLEKEGYNKSDLVLIDALRHKYAVSLNDRFKKEPVILNSFYELNIGDCEYVEIRQVFGKEKLAALIRNIYAKYLIKDLGFNPSFLKNCLALLENVPFYIIKRPKNKNSVNEIVDLILSNLKYEIKNIT